MKCLIIGSGRFIAPKLIEELVYADHSVAFLDSVPPPASVAQRVTYIQGDKDSLAFYKDECVDYKPDVAVHLSANTVDEAAAFMDTFESAAGHLVVTSSTNVYLAHARFKTTEPGPSLPVPINEDSPLRSLVLKDDEAGDKKAVEKIIQNGRLPSTILRMAPLYGPNDFLRRFYPLIIRMIDNRDHIFLGACQADWKWTHTFVHDAAHAIALAVMNPRDKGRIYNVGERATPTMRERIEQLGTVFGWEGRVGVIADSSLPDYMRTPGDFAQDLLIDSSLIRQEIEYKEKTDYYDGLAEAVEWYRENPPPHLKGKSFNYAAEDALVAKEYSAS